MAVNRIPNPGEEQFASFFRPGWFVGWHVGWWTGWWNPFDLVDKINPQELGQLVTLQGEFMSKQGQLVQELGRSLATIRTGGASTPRASGGGGTTGGAPK